MDDTVTFQNFSEETSAIASINASFPDGCIKVIFSQMEFLPWDNPDNLVSAEVETIARRFNNNFLVLLLLIGGPANVINMAVFYRQGLRDRVNLCLFALSLADELYLFAEILHYGEQLLLQFTTKERFGPFITFLTNNNFPVLTGFSFVSPVLSMIIAVERCLCVFFPIKFQHLLHTRTMAAIIVGVYTVVLALSFIICYRFRIHCVYDPLSGVVIHTGVEGEFYRAHKEFIDRLDSIMFGVGLPSIEMITVTTATVLTVVKLRQAVAWRAQGTASAITAPEVALTKMLVGNSVLFIVCISPIALTRFCWLFFPDVNLGRRKQNFFLTTIWLLESVACINATFNFFVYYAMGSRYRETFWALFGRSVKR